MTHCACVAILAGMRLLIVAMVLGACDQAVQNNDAPPSPESPDAARPDATPSPIVAECVVNRFTTVFGDGSKTVIETHFALVDGIATLENWTVEMCGFKPTLRTCPAGAFCSESGPGIPVPDCQYVHRVGTFVTGGKLHIHCGVRATSTTADGVETETTPFTGPTEIRVHFL